MRKGRINSLSEKRRKELEEGEVRLSWNSTLRPRNPDTQKRRKEKDHVYGSYHQAVSRLPCLLADHEDHECEGTVSGHHVESVGRGGVDYANEVPLCDGAHTMHPKSIHRLGSTSRFYEEWGRDLVQEAVDLVPTIEVILQGDDDLAF